MGRIPSIGGIADAGALEDSYIELFKKRDARAARLWEYAEILYNAGKLTVDDIARYIIDTQVPNPKIVYYFKNLFSANFVQKVLYAMVDNGYYDKVLEIMTYDAPDKSITTDTTWSDGVNRVHNLSIGSGITLTLGAPPAVIIADTITNSGVIKSGWWKAEGGAAATSPGRGGNGCGGLIILARTIDVGEIHADGENGESGGTTSDAANGGNGEAGLFWEIDGYPAGTGGDGGSTVSGYEGTGSKNGGGGGGVYGNFRDYGGDGGAANVITFSTAEDLLKELFKCIIDWYIKNVLGKSPTSVKTIPELGGSGGGGGAEDYNYADCGGGGGGGGEIIIFGINVTAGTVTAKGGNGGNGGSEGDRDSAGGGGGGGIIYVFYKSLSGTFTFDVSGGAGGRGDANGADGSAGSAATFQV